MSIATCGVVGSEAESFLAGVSLGISDMEPHERLVTGSSGCGVIGDPPLLEGDEGVRRLVDLENDQKYFHNSSSHINNIWDIFDKVHQSRGMS